MTTHEYGITESGERIHWEDCAACAGEAPALRAEYDQRSRQPYSYRVVRRIPLITGNRLIWVYTILDEDGHVFEQREFVTAERAEHCSAGEQWLASWGPLYREI